MKGRNPTAREKVCKICNDKFKPFNSMQKACSPKCALQVAEKARHKKEKMELAEFRQKHKTLNQRIAEAQSAVNNYVRARDESKGCISCGRNNDKQFDAGHYRSTGAANHLRFNLLNIHKQCKDCNRFLSGNVVQYRKGLIERIGEKRVIELENDNETRKFNVEYLERVKRIFRKRVKVLQKIREVRK